MSDSNEDKPGVDDLIPEDHDTAQLLVSSDGSSSRQHQEQHDDDAVAAAPACSSSPSSSTTTANSSAEAIAPLRSSSLEPSAQSPSPAELTLALATATLDTARACSQAMSTYIESLRTERDLRRQIAELRARTDEVQRERDQIRAQAHDLREVTLRLQQRFVAARMLASGDKGYEELENRCLTCLRYHHEFPALTIDPLYHLAVIYHIHLPDAPMARACYLKVLAVDPNNSGALQGLCVLCLDTMVDNALALDVLTQYIRTNPVADLTVLLLKRAMLHYYKFSDYAPAMTLFLHVLRHNIQQPPELLVVAIVFYLRFGSEDSIKQSMQDVLNKARHQFTSKFTLAFVQQFVDHDLDAAIVSMSNAKLGTSLLINSIVCFELAMLHACSRNTMLAIEYFTKALAIDPTFSEAHWQLGMLLYQHRDKRLSSKAHLEKVLSINANHVKAAKMLQEWTTEKEGTTDEVLNPEHS